MSDTEDFYSAMYGPQEDEPVAAPKADHEIHIPVLGIMSMPALSAFVRRLERTTNDQARTIAKQNEDIRRLRTQVTQLIRFGHSTRSDMSAARASISDLKSDKQDKYE